MKQGSNSGLQAGRLRRIGLNQSDIWFWDRDADFPVHTTEKEKRDGMNIYGNIKALVTYGLETGLLEREDEIFTTNRLLELFELDEMEEDTTDIPEKISAAEGGIEGSVLHIQF